jgi:hypothetical protein
VQIVKAALQDLQPDGAGKALPPLALWEQCCHTLLCTNAFTYLD